MIGYEEFKQIFGDFTLFDAVRLVLAVGFLVFAYIKWSRWDTERANRQKAIDEALNLPEEYEGDKHRNKKVHDELKESIDALSARLDIIESDLRKRDCNQLRNTLLQYYHHYANVETNPSQSWTEMEHEAFMLLFNDYESCGGNGFMHTVVLPAMEKLTIIKMGRGNIKGNIKNNCSPTVPR